MASCNSHCSTGATWPPSHRPIFPANDWWYAAIPDLAAERARKREELLAATEKALGGITIAVERKRRLLRGTTEIALAVSAVLNTYKMKKHFDLIITDDAFSFARRTPEATRDDADTVRNYKSLGRVERAFRCIVVREELHFSRRMALALMPVRH